MKFKIFGQTNAELYRFVILGYCLGASGLTVTLATIASAGVI